MDDRSSAVSLPEVPLLGVLPGTGGLTPHHRQAAWCATTWRTSSAPPPRGVRAAAGQGRGGWWTIIAKRRQRSDEVVAGARRRRWRRRATRPADAANGVHLAPLARRVDLTRNPPLRLPPMSRVEIDRRGADRDRFIVRGAGFGITGFLRRLRKSWPRAPDFYPLALQMTRELEDAVLIHAHQRAPISVCGSCTPEGDPRGRSRDGRAARCMAHRDHWFVQRDHPATCKPTPGCRLDVSSRSLFAIASTRVPASPGTFSPSWLLACRPFSYHAGPDQDDPENPPRRGSRWAG